MVLPEGFSVTDRDECDALLLHVSVKVAFDVNTHCTSAFIENRVQWLVVDKSCHGHALLLSA